MFPKYTKNVFVARAFPKTNCGELTHLRRPLRGEGKRGNEGGAGRKHPDVNFWLRPCSLSAAALQT